MDLEDGLEKFAGSGDALRAVGSLEGSVSIGVVLRATGPGVLCLVDIESFERLCKRKLGVLEERLSP